MSAPQWGGHRTNTLPCAVLRSCDAQWDRRIKCTLNLQCFQPHWKPSSSYNSLPRAPSPSITGARVLIYSRGMGDTFRSLTVDKCIGLFKNTRTQIPSHSPHQEMSLSISLSFSALCTQGVATQLAQPTEPSSNMTSRNLEQPGTLRLALSSTTTGMNILCFSFVPPSQ